MSVPLFKAKNAALPACGSPDRSPVIFSLQVSAALLHLLVIQRRCKGILRSVRSPTPAVDSAVAASAASTAAAAVASVVSIGSLLVERCECLLQYVVCIAWIYTEALIINTSQYLVLFYNCFPS